MTHKRILCVDDDENICEVVIDMLGWSGLEAVSASTMGETLRLMEGERFSLFILDGQLAGMSEPTLCEEVRTIDQETPIVVFSGQSFQPNILVGANACIVKPDFSGLISTVQRLLEAA